MRDYYAIIPEHKVRTVESKIYASLLTSFLLLQVKYHNCFMLLDVNLIGWKLFWETRIFVGHILNWPITRLLLDAGYFLELILLNFYSGVNFICSSILVLLAIIVLDQFSRIIFRLLIFDFSLGAFVIVGFICFLILINVLVVSERICSLFLVNFSSFPICWFPVKNSAFNILLCILFCWVSRSLMLVSLVWSHVTEAYFIIGSMHVLTRNFCFQFCICCLRLWMDISVLHSHEFCVLFCWI